MAVMSSMPENSCLEKWPKCFVCFVCWCQPTIEIELTLESSSFVKHMYTSQIQ